jgi:hypothetical protein
MILKWYILKKSSDGSPSNNQTPLPSNLKTLDVTMNQNSAMMPNLVLNFSMKPSLPSMLGTPMEIVILTLEIILKIMMNSMFYLKTVTIPMMIPLLLVNLWTVWFGLKMNGEISTVQLLNIFPDVQDQNHVMNAQKLGLVKI